MDCRWLAIFAVETDERVDLEVCEVEVDVDAVKPDQEVDESVLLGCWHLSEESALDLVTRRELLVDGDEELESLGVDIANFDTTFVSEEDVVAFACGVDANVELRIGRMRKERLDDEVVDSSSDSLNLNIQRSANDRRRWCG